MRVRIISALLVLLFVYAAASKLLFIKGFTNQMLNQPLPVWLSRSLVWMLPAAELYTAGLLAFRTTRRTGLYMSLGLMMAFTGYVMLVLSKAFERIPCSCGGIISQFSWPAHLALNLVTLMLITLGLFWNKAHEGGMISKNL
jgi:putative oxidoreductase